MNKSFINEMISRIIYSTVVFYTVSSVTNVQYYCKYCVLLQYYSNSIRILYAHGSEPGPSFAPAQNLLTQSGFSVGP